MWSYRMYFADSQEHFEYDPWGALGSAATQRSYPYLESLLSFWSWTVHRLSTSFTKS